MENVQGGREGEERREGRKKGREGKREGREEKGQEGGEKERCQLSFYQTVILLAKHAQSTVGGSSYTHYSLEHLHSTHMRSPTPHVAILSGSSYTHYSLEHLHCTHMMSPTPHGDNAFLVSIM